MEWKEANSVLNKHYPKKQREIIYKQKRLDGSETDTIKSNKINSDLLRAYELKEKDKDECEKIYQAADYYEREFYRQQGNQ